MYYYKEGWNSDIEIYEYWIMSKDRREIISVASKIEDAKNIVVALNKQIPQKLNLRGSGVCECSNCKTLYAYTEYCSGCGQKIDMNSVR